MNPRFLTFLAPLIVLSCAQAHAQSAPHPGAEEALERIVLDQDFGDSLMFDSREVTTIASNTAVTGLNGLLFMRWKGTDPAMEVTASVQWFERAEDLLAFYRKEKARTARGLQVVDDAVIWKTSEQSYLWTDGKHFVVGIGGSPAPPEEMLKAWLELIESNLPDLAPVAAASP